MTKLQWIGMALRLPSASTSCAGACRPMVIRVASGVGVAFELWVICLSLSVQ